MWDLPGPGLEPMSPALAGRLLTTAPRGKPCFVCFAFIYLFLPWETGLRKYYCDLCQRMFSSRSCMVCDLAVRSLNHFEFIFVYAVRECYNLIVLHVTAWLSSFPSTTYWRDSFFSIVYSCILCHRLIDHRYVGLFLVSLFCSIDQRVCFCASTMLFWLL